MRTRCKFHLREVTHYPGGAVNVKMSAVTGGTQENEQFCKFTPQGEFTAFIDNPAVVPMMKPGRDFYLDLIPVEEDRPEVEQGDCAEHRV